MQKKIHPSIKTSLHPRNKHRERYDFVQLISSYPALSTYVKVNKYGDESIDFFNPKAVKLLNKALLVHHYGIEYWDIPTGYLCPPIPGRADYIHHIADVLGESRSGNVSTGDQITCLDIGVGANCVYPLIGAKEYGWSFIGSETDPVALASATEIVEKNAGLSEKIQLRIQPDPKQIFANIIQPGEHIDVSICNPPFHASQAEAEAGSRRKIKNLRGSKKKQKGEPVLNFGGQSHELWTPGGEVEFITRMVSQSKQFSSSCSWFSTLVSKESNLKKIYKSLQKANALEVKTVTMGQGNKTSRIIAWTFLDNTH